MINNKILIYRYKLGNANFLALFFLCLLQTAVFAQQIKEIPLAPARQNMPTPQSAAVSGARIQTGIEQSTEPLNILFVLDCSLSMKEKMKDQEQKIEAAKQVLQQSLARIPGDVNTGLRVFGQGQSRNNFMNECQQTELLVPLGQGNRRAIIEQVRGIRAFGMTPLTYALEQAAKGDFAAVQGKKVIILISDGADTCGGDPCRLIQMLPAYGIHIKIDVVGLDLKRDKQAREQLNCIAEHSGGRYYDANSADQFINSVSESVNTAITGRVLPKVGTSVNPLGESK